jgi:hypothetical protein
MWAKVTGRGLTAAAGFGALWLGAGLILDDSTFHLAPAIVTAAAVATATRPSVGVLIGVVVASIVAVALEAAGRLDGPSLLPWGDATLETWIAVVAGIGAGFVVSASGLVTERG